MPEGGVAAFDELLEIVARLRGPGGCPWDRVQTWESMRPYIIEETFELVDAIDRADRQGVRGELGDVLFQVVLLAQMASDEGWFDLQDVARGIGQKMIDRHPHVFDPHFDPATEASGIGAWERRKAKERGKKASVLDGVPNALPSLLRAHRVSEKASMVGFDWADAAGVRKKVEEELHELDEAMAAEDVDAIQEEFGDLLFSLVNLGRHLPGTAEDALRLATQKFERRFRAVEAAIVADGGSIHHTDLDELEQRWKKAKEDLD